MSYIGEPFEVDVFISYSQGVDDKIGRDASQLFHWSKRFQKCFDSELRQEYPREDLALFYDTNRRPTERLDLHNELRAGIQAKAESSAILLAMISNWFADSAWCQCEIDWWKNSLKQRGIDFENKVVIAKVWVDPPPKYRNWDEALEKFGLTDRGGRDFCDHVQRRPFGWFDQRDCTVEEMDRDFRKKIIDLVTDVRDKFKELKKTLADQQAVAPTPALLTDACKTVCVQGRPDMNSELETVATALRTAGFTVLPNWPEASGIDAAQSNEINKQRAAALRTSDALLIVAPTDLAHYWTELSAGKFAADEATDNSGRKIPCAVIDATADQELAKTRAGQAGALGLKWLDQNSESWLTEFGTWFRELRR